MESNPYLAPNEVDRRTRNPFGWRRTLFSIAWFVLILYPAIAISSIYLYYLLIVTFDLRGAEPGSYADLASIAFNTMVNLLIGIPFVAPMGLIVSFFPPFGRSRLSIKRRLLYPGCILLFWAALAAWIYADLGGFFSWLYDV